MIAKANEGGNGGVGSFLSRTTTTTIDQIRYDAPYVANAYGRTGQLVMVCGQRTGVLIECHLRDGQVEAAYPHPEDRAWRPRPNLLS